MNIQQLQSILKNSGRYPGKIDGDYGPLTRAAVLLAMTDGPDTRLTEDDFEASAERLRVTVPHIKAVTAVESAGAGFSGGRPIILFEPHRFSRATKHRFDSTHPTVSYPSWDASRYPRSQAMRWAQLEDAVGLDVDAGFASASYGRFQILGENFAACGYKNPFDFAYAQAYDEQKQLAAFESFLISRGLDALLRASDWAAFARAYNGSAYRENRYDTRLAAAFAEASA